MKRPFDSRSLSQGKRARAEIRALADPQRAVGVARFFKTGPGQYGAGDRFLGIRVPEVRRLARIHQDLALPDTLQLLKSRWHEERLLALLIMVRQYRRTDDRQRAAIHRAYLAHMSYVNNWDLVDCSAEHIVGAHLQKSQSGAVTATGCIDERLGAADCRPLNVPLRTAR